MGTVGLRALVSAAAAILLVRTVPAVAASLCNDFALDAAAVALFVDVIALVEAAAALLSLSSLVSAEVAVVGGGDVSRCRFASFLEACIVAARPARISRC